MARYRQLQQFQPIQPKAGIQQVPFEPLAQLIQYKGEQADNAILQARNITEMPNGIARAASNKSEVLPGQKLSMNVLSFDQPQFDATSERTNLQAEEIVRNIYNNPLEAHRYNTFDIPELTKQYYNEIAPMRSRYNQVTAWQEKNEKEGAKDPSEYNAWLSMGLKNLEERTAVDKNAGFQLPDFVAKPDFVKDNQYLFNALKDNVSVRSDGVVTTKQGGVSANRINNTLMGIMSSEPKTAAYLNQYKQLHGLEELPDLMVTIKDSTGKNLKVLNPAHPFAGDFQKAMAYKHSFSETKISKPSQKILDKYGYGVATLDTRTQRIGTPQKLIMSSENIAKSLIPGNEEIAGIDRKQALIDIVRRNDEYGKVKGDIFLTLSDDSKKKIKKSDVLQAFNFLDLMQQGVNPENFGVNKEKAEIILDGLDLQSISGDDVGSQKLREVIGSIAYVGSMGATVGGTGGLFFGPIGAIVGAALGGAGAAALQYFSLQEKEELVAEQIKKQSLSENPEERKLAKLAYLQTFKERDLGTGAMDNKSAELILPLLNAEYGLNLTKENTIDQNIIFNTPLENMAEEYDIYKNGKLNEIISNKKEYVNFVPVVKKQEQNALLSYLNASFNSIDIYSYDGEKVSEQDKSSILQDIKHMGKISGGTYGDTSLSITSGNNNYKVVSSDGNYKNIGYAFMYDDELQSLVQNTLQKPEWQNMQNGDIETFENYKIKKTGNDYTLLENDGTLYRENGQEVRNSLQNLMLMIVSGARESNRITLNRYLPQQQ